MIDMTTVEFTLQSINSYFHKSITTRKTIEGRNEAREMKILALNGMEACYSCEFSIVIDEIRKTRNEME